MMGGVEVEIDQLSDRFAEHFQQKIENLSANIEIDEHVYNGVSKFTTGDKNFMTSENILKAVQSIKLKNSEGHDRIPQRLLIEGISVLLQPLTSLFDNIYISKQIPEQWSLAKIVPIHKKGMKNEMSNYRPVANLCAATKIYERLILQRIQEIEEEENVDITGENQHGFKRKRSTTTAGLAIQSALARALDLGEFALMANLDLSSAFDVVNVKLLLKRMRIVGLPNDIIKLVWRFGY